MGPVTEPPEYQHAIDQCDVQNKAALELFRARRAQWVSWLNHDEHVVAPAISTLVWNDVSFRVLAHAAELEPKGNLANPLIAEALIGGHFATQTLAIRRLVDKRKDVISLSRLLADIGDNVDLFTRENFAPPDIEDMVPEGRKDRGQSGNRHSRCTCRESCERLNSIIR